MLPSGLFYFTKKAVRKLKIKKVDDKPMVIHTKQKAEIHTHEPKQASIKGNNIYMVALRDEGKLIGYYEKHEYRNAETMKQYDLWQYFDMD